MQSQLDFFGQPAENKNPVFFNTIKLPEPELKDAKISATIQNARVMDIFKQHGKLTPLEAWRHYCNVFPEAPATSIRRSITVLTGLGLLQKTDEKKPEVYGKPNYFWKIV
jgi:Fe2+ or Zn2+ uptake regulation protein